MRKDRISTSKVLFWSQSRTLSANQKPPNVQYQVYIKKVRFYGAFDYVLSSDYQKGEYSYYWCSSLRNPNPVIYES